ncbi:MAG: adenylyl-sulfate kinase [Sulfurimonas denitrificans]|nr:adenylyl-sulfate kinase [Sulfurimonas denitrificans]
MSFLVWITGLSGSGKTTIGKNVFKKLKKEHSNIVFLDGDVFREILGNDLSYSKKDRIKNAKRIHKMCKFLVNQDISVVCATMSLFKEIHRLNRDNITNYHEVFIECDLEELIKRDQKGLYSKSKKNVVGIDLDYDKPKQCELTIDNTQKNNLESKANEILALLKGKNETR